MGRRDTTEIPDDVMEAQAILMYVERKSSIKASARRHVQAALLELRQAQLELSGCGAVATVTVSMMVQ